MQIIHVSSGHMHAAELSVRMAKDSMKSDMGMRESLKAGVRDAEMIDNSQGQEIEPLPDVCGQHA